MLLEEELEQEILEEEQVEELPNQEVKEAEEVVEETPKEPAPEQEPEQKAQYIDFADVKVNNNLVLSITESSKTVDQIKKGEKVTHIIFTVFTYAFIIALALIVIFPFYWMIITSLKTYAEITQETQTFFPSVVMWSNFCVGL